MTPYTQPGSPRSRVRQQGWAQRFMTRYRGSSALREAFNVGKGLLIGCAIVLLLWLMGA
jgi:hypothetical protein